MADVVLELVKEIRKAQGANADSVVVGTLRGIISATLSILETESDTNLARDRVLKLIDDMRTIYG